VTIYDFRTLGFQKGAVAVVTGAGNGIGRSVALMLGKSGLSVAAWDYEKDAVEAVVTEIESEKGTAVPIIADITRQDEIDSAWDQTDALGASVRYLVNNAGPASTTELSVAEGVRIAVGSSEPGHIERSSVVGNVSSRE
jgi:NADP-dependent 3-hydroxy acid dehydrogenase YdfG